LVDVVRKIKLFGFSCVDLPLNSSCIRSSGEKVENILETFYVNKYTKVMTSTSCNLKTTR